MSYDVLVWPVDRDMTTEEAIADIEARSSRWKLGLRRDRRIDAFERAMQARFPGIGTMCSQYPMEFDVAAEYVHVTLPWSMVEELFETIAPLAYDAGLALFDPQRELVALPAPFGTGPLGTKGVEEHERQAQSAISAIASGALFGSTRDPMAEANEFARGAGYKTMSPLGFEITPDLQAEVMADPSRVPTSLQTPERRQLLIAQLDDGRAGRRHEALGMLGGWNPDPEVRAALLPLLESDDAFTVGFAANAIARQGEAADLPALLAATHRMSPADGGSTDAMWMPLGAAFELARATAPDQIEEIKDNARAWRVPASGARPARPGADAGFEEMLEIMAAGPEARLPFTN